MSQERILFFSGKWKYKRQKQIAIQGRREYCPIPNPNILMCRTFFKHCATRCGNPLLERE